MIRVLTTYFNSSAYIERTINSLKNQTVDDWMCYITNDCSTDGSEIFLEYITQNDDRFVIINNKEKMWQTGNYYQCIHRPEVNDEDILISLDGDDWLYDEEVFERVLKYYEGNWLMVFGQFVYYDGDNKPFRHGFTKKPEPFKDARILPWTSSHLRTFKAGLIKRVRKEDLMKPDGSSFIEMAGDVAYFSPCLEMAGEERVRYVNDLNYVYNVETPMNESKTNLQYSIQCSQYIGSLPRYEKI